jgi:hypothetical protein
VRRSRDWAPRRVEGATTASVGADAVVLDARGSPVLHLNETARAIWELCDGSTTLDEMVDACVTLFDVGEDQALREVSAALEDLELAGVLT